VVYAFGASYPVVICAPLRLCTVELQPGERVNGMFVGDSVRWKVEPTISGKGARQRVDVVIKPSNPGLTTSMVISTSRRVYHIGLKSSLHSYMARVTFSYNDECCAERDVRYRSPMAAAEANSDRRGGYSVRGDYPSWRPKKVYNDGARTYIEFSQAAVGKVPPLYVVTGGPLDSRLMNVNYRVKGNKMVVDKVFEKAVLVSGMHRAKPTRVVIERQG